MATPVGTSSGWQRIRKLFHSALARGPTARVGYLDQACAGDSDVRREVESLVAADAQVGSSLADPVGTPRHRSSRRADRSTLPAGTQVGPFNLVEFIGAGGMGEVYRARDPRLGRDVALKVLPSDLAADPQRRERFLREARMVSALNHPNICTIHEVGQTDGLDYICFEHIEGQTLGAVLEGPALSFDRVLELSLPLAEALAYAHGRRILHRDLKPANIMLSARGPKILDFGLARVLATGASAADSSSSLTDSGLVIGTVAYMSPEQALGREVDERSDVFSLGAVLYEMASGNPAFVGRTSTEVLDAVLHQDPVPLVNVRQDLPAGLSLVVQKALRKSTAERYQSMAEMVSDVEQLRLGAAAGTRLIAAGRRRISSAGIAAAVAVSVVLGVVALPRWRATPPATPTTTALAVIYFENISDRTDADNVGRMLATLVTTELGSTDAVQVVSTQRLADIARQLGKVDGPDHAVATEVARRAGAAMMVLGQVMRAGPRIVATAELVDVASGQRLGSYRAEGTVPEDVFAMATGLGIQLRQKVTGRPSQSGPQPLTRQLTTSLDAYRAYVRGETLIHRWEWDKAANEFRQATQLDPDFALAHYRLAIALSLSRFGSLGPEGRAAAERAVALKDKLPSREREVVEGAALIYAGRLSDAVPILEAVLARDPDNKELLHLLSVCYMGALREANPRRAAELMERLLVLDPDFRLAYRGLAMAYAKSGDFATARERLDAWEAKEPESVRAIRGLVTFLEGRFDEAIRLSEPPPTPIASLWRCYYAMAAGRFDIVRRVIAEQERLPKPTVPHFSKTPSCGGVVENFALYNGQFDRVEPSWRKWASGLRPEASEAADAGMEGLHNFADLAALKGDLQAARRAAEKALLVQPEGPYSLYVAGVFAVRVSDLAAAERHLRKLEDGMAASHGPLVPHYRDALVAEIALARGRPSEARPLLEKAVHSGKLGYAVFIGLPGIRFRDALARTYLALGEKEKAAEVLEALLAEPQGAFTPVQRVRALYRVGALRMDLGDRARGREYLQKFLDRWGKADWDLFEVRDARARLALSSS